MPNKIYVARESRITFEPSGGNAALTLTSLGAGAGRISGQIDRGDVSHAQIYEGVLRTAWETTPVADEVLRIYLAEAWEFRNDGTPETDVGGDLPSSDSGISSEDRLSAGADMIGRQIVPPSPASGTEYVSLPFRFRTAARYLQVGVWNATADALSSTASHHELAIWPVPPEVQ